RSVARWVDGEDVGTTTIALGRKRGRDGSIGGNGWAVVGKEESVVNGGILKAAMLTRVLDHLTTPTSYLEFSPQGQLLVMSSCWKNNALRLVYLPSCTVYRNWPTDKTLLGRITAIAW
ncbi:hypothetical protein BU16DRAFT_418801, partial [Lophium mytilinum]